MTSAAAWTRLNRRIVSCTRCPRLVAWRNEVARVRTRRFIDQSYWGRPVPGFGDPAARLLLVGLAPAAHGANRTGRMFTGDRSGEWLYRALHAAGFASAPASVSTDDGLSLHDCYITATCRCAPPANKPLPEEIAACAPYLAEEFRLLTRLRVVVGLGRTGFDAARRLLAGTGVEVPPSSGFRHGASFRLGNGMHLLASFHPSQQNTFTGRLTRPMFQAVFRRARRLLAEER